MVSAAFDPLPPPPDPIPNAIPYSTSNPQALTPHPWSKLQPLIPGAPPPLSPILSYQPSRSRPRSAESEDGAPCLILTLTLITTLSRSRSRSRSRSLSLPLTRCVVFTDEPKEISTAHETSAKVRQVRK